MEPRLAIQQLKSLKKSIKNIKLRLAAEWDEPWKVLISTILSAQNRDSKTIPVCENLFDKYNTPAKLGSAKIESISKIVQSINYHKSKARYIKETSKFISKKGIPETLSELIKLPGVGRKTANIYLSEAKKVSTIAVDTHVKRISLKLGWTKNENPNKIEKDLEELFPKKYWREINHSLVLFGQSHGRSRKKEDQILAKLINHI
jgi:endonuclease-3